MFNVLFIRSHNPIHPSLHALASRHGKCASMKQDSPILMPTDYRKPNKVEMVPLGQNDT